MDMKKERLKRGLTTQQVAEKLGVTTHAVTAWECGTRNPSKQIIMLVEDGKLD